MTNLNKIKKYIDLIDSYIDSENQSHMSHPHHTTHSIPPELSYDDSGPTTLRLSNENDYDKYTENQLIMLHSLCHLFKDRGAIGMSKEDIKNAHSEIKLRLSNHEKFDNLDE